MSNTKKVTRKPATRATHSETKTSNPVAVGWVSNAPWAATGYGEQTAQVTQRLKNDGHDVGIFSNYGLEGAASEWQGMRVWPRGAEQYSNDVTPAQMQEHFQNSKSDTPLLITLYDVWVFKGSQWDNWPIASWVPVDHAPCPAEVARWLAKPNVTPIAMSKFGKQQLENIGLESLYVPHGIDTKTFKPTPYLINDQGEQVTGNELIGFGEDKFIVMFAAANKGVYPSRKAFAENLIAFRMFSDLHDDAVLYLHTEQFGGMGGINLNDLLSAIELKPDKVRFVDQYAYRGPLSKEYLAACYTAADVFLACSKGEGFGVHVPEAQACGTPVIVSDYSAQPELVGHGWIVDGQPDWDPMQRSWWITPNINTIVEALEQAYANGKGTSAKAIEFAANYDCDVVYKNHWRPALELLTKP
jgi:glycosyltransferase involved in cell wall biosynthesis